MVENRKEAQPPSEVPESAENEAAAEASAEGETVRVECEELLVRKEDEIKQLQDRILRLAAEMENTRKRLERERTEGICFANESLIREMLPVVDNLERAIDHAPKDTEGETLLEGVRMTAKSFLDVLAKFGCVPFESVGKPFDPNFHEAIMQQESPDQPENTVVQEFQKGYTIRDRLLRPAMVVVSKGGSQE